MKLSEKELQRIIPYEFAFWWGFMYGTGLMTLEQCIEKQKMIDRNIRDWFEKHYN